MVFEWFFNDEVIYCVDIYVLVCVLYECLIGVLLYCVDSVGILVSFYLMGFIFQFSVICLGIFKVFDVVVVCGMVKKFEDCYVSVGDLVLVVYEVFSDFD